MTNVKERLAVIQFGIPQGQIVDALILIVDREIGHALTPSPVGVPSQSMRETLSELKLKTIVIVPSAVIDKVHAVRDKRIEQEEVDRVRTRNVCRWQHARARTEIAAEHAAHIILTCGQRVSQRSRLAILQIRDEACALISRSSGDGDQRSPRAKGRVKDRERELARAAEVLEAVYVGGLINCQITLCVQEFLQKSVFENVHFVQVTRAPREVRLITNISGFENCILPQLALDADCVVLRVRRAQIRIKAAHNAPAECLIRHVERLRIGVSGESKVRKRERTGYEIRQGVE